MHSLKKYIGVPFLDGGRDPSVGLDCWGLFLLVEKEFGISVPDFTIYCDDAESISSTFGSETVWRWEEIEKPEPGCGVAMAIKAKMPGYVQHFGVYIGHGKFIHTLRGIGSCISSVNDPAWKKRIKGFYRWAA